MNNKFPTLSYGDRIDIDVIDFHGRIVGINPSNRFYFVKRDSGARGVITFEIVMDFYGHTSSWEFDKKNGIGRFKFRQKY